MSATRPPLPPFTHETAVAKVQAAEDGWNSRDARKVALAYTEDTRWRNRAEFADGRTAVEALLVRKWDKELEYRLIKELWAFTGNRISVRFRYEYRDDSHQWHVAYGNEQWEFEADGLMRRREASINEHPIREDQRRYFWPLGPRPADHPGLTEMGL
jgi:nuclear transport factor 2 (NTF2) superfamily protein